MQGRFFLLLLLWEAGKGLRFESTTSVLYVDGCGIVKTVSLLVSCGYISFAVVLGRYGELRVEEEHRYHCNSRSHTVVCMYMAVISALSIHGQCCSWLALRLSTFPSASLSSTDITSQRC